jgi:hypothetical protein
MRKLSQLDALSLAFILFGSLALVYKYGVKKQ